MYGPIAPMTTAKPMKESTTNIEQAALGNDL
jgi:hypothetical protein